MSTILLLALLACGSSSPPPAAPRESPPAPRPSPAPSAPEPTRSLRELGAIVPRTLSQLHLVHLAQLEEALRGTGLPGVSREWVAQGLHESIAAATAEDLALVRELVRAEPGLAVPVLEAVRGEEAFAPPRVAPALVQTVDAIVMSGPPDAKAWALLRRWAGAAGDVRAFARTMLAEASGSGRCPPPTEQLGTMIEEIFGTRAGVPCLDAAAPSPDAFAHRPVEELLATIEVEGLAGEAAASALRRRVQEQPPLLSAAQFGAVVELAASGRMQTEARQSLVLQLFTTAHDQVGWLEWLAAHPDRVALRHRPMAALLLETPPDPALAARWREAHAALTRPAGSVPPAGPDFRLPDESAATLEAAWALADGVREPAALRAYYGELFRSTVADRPSATIAARHDQEIVRALGRCRELVAAHQGDRWIDRALAAEAANAGDFVAELAASAWTPRLRRFVLEALGTAPDAWARVLWRALDLHGRPRDVPAARIDALLTRPRVHSALLMTSDSDVVWQRAPEDLRTDAGVLAMVVRVHAEPLLGSWPDVVEAAEPEPSDPRTSGERWFRASSREQPGFTVRILLAIAPHDGPLRPNAVMRIVR